MLYGRIKSYYLFGLLFILGFFSISSFKVNPIYVIAIIPIALTPYFIDLKKVKKIEIVYFLYIFILLVSFSIGIHTFKKLHQPNYLSSLLYLLSVFLGWATYTFGKNTSLNQRIKIYKYSFRLLSIFMAIDLIIRIGFALKKDPFNFYSYKFGIFHWDSNFSGIIILLFLMFHLFLKKNKIFKISRLHWSLLVFLLLSTFSRSAIIVFIFFQLYFQIPKKINKKLLPLLVFLSTLILIIAISSYLSGYNFIHIDGSFNSKFHLISLAIKNYDLLPTVNKLFGIGMNNFQYISNGIFAHNILVTYVYELGLIGSLVTVLFFLYCYKKIGFGFNYILLPYLTVGLSLFSAYSSTFFILVSCMIIESSRIK